uniref:PX domain-containing protein n=1 Tax=Amorphochlora amoebiformis TaxID=1561963 RepID=A0A7S0H4S9_9EUKA|mmetsp:Transcript_29251/g.46683  ORF Transcript_29251/g.46683 Transcript_29251/m.46683 type:complete len:482 (+) Transcript_29251:388-1833(+)
MDTEEKDGNKSVSEGKETKQVKSTSPKIRGLGASEKIISEKMGRESPGRSAPPPVGDGEWEVVQGLSQFWKIRIEKAIIDDSHHAVFYRIRVDTFPTSRSPAKRGRDCLNYYLHKRYRDFHHFDKRLRSSAQAFNLDSEGTLAAATDSEGRISAEHLLKISEKHIPNDTVMIPRSNQLPTLPPKRQITNLFSSSFDKSFVHARRQALQKYINELLMLPNIHKNLDFRAFFSEPNPGSVTEVTLFNGQFLVESQPVLFIAVYHDESNSEDRHILELVDKSAEKLRGRVAFGRIHTIKEQEMVTKLFSKPPTAPSIWIFRRDYHPFQYRGKLEIRALASLAMAYYKPAAQRWKALAQRTLKRAGLEDMPIKLVVDFCSIRWHDGILSIPRYRWHSHKLTYKSTISMTRGGKEGSEEEEKKDKVQMRYFIGIVGVMEDQKLVCSNTLIGHPLSVDINEKAIRDEEANAQVYKQAFMDRMLRAVR